MIKRQHRSRSMSRGHFFYFYSNGTLALNKDPVLTSPLPRCRFKVKGRVKVKGQGQRLGSGSKWIQILTWLVPLKRVGPVTLKWFWPWPWVTFSLDLWHFNGLDLKLWPSDDLDLWPWTDLQVTLTLKLIFGWHWPWVDLHVTLILKFDLDL